MKLPHSLTQLFRYGFIGICSNLTAYSLYLLMTYMGFSPKIVMSFIYVIGAGIGFVANRKWTFEHKGHYFNTGARFLIAHVLGYLLNLSILFVMVDKLGYLHQWVQASAIFIIAIFLFLSFKFFVFKPIKEPVYIDSLKDLECVTQIQK